MTGFSAFAVAVNAYSARGGTSANSCREISPSAWSSQLRGKHMLRYTGDGSLQFAKAVYSLIEKPKNHQLPFPRDQGKGLANLAA